MTVTVQLHALLNFTLVSQLEAIPVETEYRILKTDSRLPDRWPPAVCGCVVMTRQLYKYRVDTAAECQQVVDCFTCAVATLNRRFSFECLTLQNPPMSDSLDGMLTSTTV